MHDLWVIIHNFTRSTSEHFKSTKKMSRFKVISKEKGTHENVLTNTKFCVKEEMGELQIKGLY